MAFRSPSARRGGAPSALRRRLSRTDPLAASLSMLAATLESTADGILVVDLAGRIVGRNSKFGQMWGMSPEVLDRQDVTPLLDHAAEQTADPASFRARIAELDADPDMVATDEVELADGRVFSRYTQPQRIDGQVAGRVWSFRDRTAERRLEQGLRRMAYTDELTGLPNRALFMARGRAMAEAAEATGRPLGVAVLDLDHLKAVNDQLGHRSGDEILTVAATRLRAAARAEDVVARLGGDEFGVLLPDASPATVEAVLQRMADAMSGALVLCGRTVSATVSGGSSVGTGAGTGTVSLETLLHEADLAMYRAKSGGRGRVHAYDEQISRSDPRTAAAEVHDVLADPQGLTVVRQPICQLSTGVLVGHEALSRFPGRSHRDVGEWFALARDGGTAPALESRAITLAREEHDPAGGTYLTVNVSPSVLGAALLQDALCGDLTGLVIEVTEDSRLDMTELSRLLERLRGRGARIAMDDTGAGYDGLRRLVRLRPEIVKLDRELVHAVHQHPEKRAMVEALVSFCRQTGSVMCAEGIENVEELRTLVELGVDLGQGWFVGRPASGWPPVSRAAAEACGGIGDVTPGDMDRLRAQLDRAATVFDVAQAAQRALTALQADDLCVSLLDGGDLVQVDRPAWTTNVQRWVLSDYPATASCLARSTILAVRADDPAADAAEVRQMREAGYRSLLAVPLDRDGEPRGLLEVFSRANRSWSDREVRVCRYLADEVSDALDRIERTTGVMA